ncbi:MAG TPA: hypothetical protein PLG73_14725 [Candidatus Sumerlaeota bacterium]|nr:hypothetical protein [Candidatus Sumerlaeota bacterium]
MSASTEKIRFLHLLLTLAQLPAFAPASWAQETFDLEDYFILTQGSRWHYTAINGASTDDDFAWEVLPETITVTGGHEATRIYTDVDDPGDSRMDDEDFWYFDSNGDLYFAGFHNGVADGGGTFPAQTIILTDPIKIGGRDMEIGEVVMDTGAGTVQTALGPINATIQSTITYIEVMDQVVTPLGNFKNAIRLHIEISGSAGFVNFDIKDADVILARHVGMILQSQEFDQDDAEAHAIDGGFVAGMTITDDPPCTNFLNPMMVGTIDVQDLEDPSGLAVSTKNPGVLWTHDDDGAAPNLYAISTTGAHLGTFTITGLAPGDWEDLAVGPGPDAQKTYLYIADIGDNAETRAQINIYRVEEPAVSSSQAPPLMRNIASFENFPLVFPDAPDNAEAFLLDPTTLDFYIIVKKGGGKSRVWKAAAPHTHNQQATLELIDTLYFDNQVTGGAVNQDGSQFAVRTSTEIFTFTIPAGKTMQEVITGFTYQPCVVSTMTEDDGEAVAFNPNGGFYTTQEVSANKAGGQPLFFYPDLASNAVGGSWTTYR